jgi:allantoicase
MISFDDAIYPDAGIKFFDILGDLVLEIKNPGNKAEIDLSDQADGIYILTITIGKEQYNRKIIIQK